MGLCLCAGGIEDDKMMHLFVILIEWMLVSVSDSLPSSGGV